ncbi:hypothetical protein [Halomonas mongoliensis]|uniref:hypothetical protein n=1 Tax=Halomonas mongoliensis TaxID=321265 RepID=UPI00403AFDC0
MASTATASAPSGVDRDDLEARVKSMYREVAETPEADFHFEMGRALAERLGYDPAGALQASPYHGDGHLLGTPDDLERGPVASMGEGAEIAIIEGNLGEEAPFTFRLRMADGYEIRPRLTEAGPDTRSPASVRPGGRHGPGLRPWPAAPPRGGRRPA